MLTLTNVGKKYSGERTVEAVKDVSFVLERGKFLTLMGRSGSGKSTLLASIGGISKPTSGKVIIDGIDQWSLSDDEHSDFRNRSIGYVFQFASLLPTLRAIDNVALPALVGGTLSAREAYARARVLLTQVGLAERQDFYAAQLSGGEQRRVAIARALINAPQLLLADEPTADLDEATEEEILNLLVDIHKAYNLTLIVVTHNPDIASRADRMLQLSSGVVTSDGVVEQAAMDTSSDSNQSEQKKIFDLDNTAIQQEKVTLGAGFERLLGKLVILVVPLVAVFWLVNFAVSSFEKNMLEAKAEQRSAVEELAMKDLRADIKNIEFGPGKSYVVSIYLQNTAGDKPIYVMSPTVRGFIQVGSSWQEVKLTAKSGPTAKVATITGEHIYEYLLEPDIADFAQLLPYYMHIRLSNDMLVSPSSEPKDDLVERSDNYYVYLKPHDADDAAILKKMKFPGKPPVWIPMPPH